MPQLQYSDSYNPMLRYQKMLNNDESNNHMVLVEISVIPIGSNGQTPNEIIKVQDIVGKTGLSYTPIQNGACIQGRWDEVSALIFACYQQVQEQFPQGFVRVAIR